MNKRIEELRRQAIDHCLDKGSQGNLSEEVAEKFAELIVRECAGLCSNPVVVLQHWGIDSESE